MKLPNYVIKCAKTGEWHIVDTNAIHKGEEFQDESGKEWYSVRCIGSNTNAYLIAVALTDAMKSAVEAIAGFYEKV